MRFRGIRLPVKYCMGKVIYDKKGALTVKNKRFEEDHVPLRIYPCPVCHGWHLTSQV
jgi:hypothetical protein